MLTILRILAKALETEQDRINDRKVSSDEIDVYESILNYDFTDSEVNSAIVIDAESSELDINWELSRHGKKWTHDEIQDLLDMCFDGKSILEMLVKSGRSIGPLLKKLNEYGWYFEKVDGVFRLVQYGVVDNDLQAHNTIIYNPKHFCFGYVEIKKGWLLTEVTFGFKYPFTGIDKKDLNIEFFHNENSKIIEINKDFQTYTLHSGGKEIFNSKFKIEHSKLGSITFNLNEPNDYFINVLYYSKEKKAL